TAGTFVCNQVFYVLMRALVRRSEVRAGFVHVPWLPEQAARHQGPGMALDDIVRGIESIVETSLTTTADACASAGAEC
ncbi:MAG: pyroglutamyl-peptidase I, partial [Xanthomonadales bacterium]|nr:pyroglutamyl-peptidase I [Xanthomonadales bacterium]